MHLFLLLLSLNAAPRELDLKTLLQRAPIVLLAEVADPRNQVIDLPLGDKVFQRLRRQFRLVEVLRGNASRTPLPQVLAVDEPRWQAQYRAALMCQKSRKCKDVVVDRYRGTLAKEPVPGAKVLLFLKRNALGELELAADQAMEAETALASVRARLHARAQRPGQAVQQGKQP